MRRFTSLSQAEMCAGRSDEPDWSRRCPAFLQPHLGGNGRQTTPCCPTSVSVQTPSSQASTSLSERQPQGRRAMEFFISSAPGELKCLCTPCNLCAHTHTLPPWVKRGSHHQQPRCLVWYSNILHLCPLRTPSVRPREVRHRFELRYNNHQPAVFG